MTKPVKPKRKKVNNKSKGFDKDEIKYYISTFFGRYERTNKGFKKICDKEYR